MRPPLSDQGTDDEFVYTEEPARGHLFVGAITDEMVERAAEALREANHALLPLNSYRKLARLALSAALRQSERCEESS